MLDQPQDFILHSLVSALFSKNVHFENCASNSPGQGSAGVFCHCTSLSLFVGGFPAGGPLSLFSCRRKNAAPTTWGGASADIRYNIPCSFLYGFGGFTL